jgi:hypothetical protein
VVEVLHLPHPKLGGLGLGDSGEPGGGKKVCLVSQLEQGHDNFCRWLRLPLPQKRHGATRSCTLPLHTQAAQGDRACACVRACVASLPMPRCLLSRSRPEGGKASRGRRRRIRGQDGMPVAFRPFPRAEQGSGEQAAVEGAGGRRTPPRRGRAPFPRCPLVPEIRNTGVASRNLLSCPLRPAPRGVCPRRSPPPLPPRRFSDHKPVAQPWGGCRIEGGLWSVHFSMGIERTGPLFFVLRLMSVPSLRLIGRKEGAFFGN